MKIPIPGLAVHAVALGWTSTWRLMRVHEERVAQAQSLGQGGSVVGILWHQSLLMAAACHHHRRVAALVSRSQDGALIAAHLERIGIRTVRGSSRRGAAEGAKELMRAIQDGWMISTPCDGPTGPIYRPKAGLLEIARRYRIPVVPMGYGALNHWDIPIAWDRFRIPWPGTRVAVAYGEPIMYPPEEPDDAEMARRIDAAAASIHGLEREAMAALGRRER